MLKSIVKHAILIFALLAAQLSLISPVGGILGNLNLVLVVLIFIAVVYGIRLAVIYGIIIGLAMDVYSSLNFGVIVIAFLLALNAVHEIADRLLTNKSVYALIGLTAVGTGIYNFIVSGWTVAARFIQTKDWLAAKVAGSFFINNFVWQLFFNLILAIVIFMFFHFSSRRFKAVFIDTSR